MQKGNSYQKNFMDGLIYDLRRQLHMKPCDELNGLDCSLMIINIVL